MSIKIFHTGDIHIGMKYNTNYPDDVREALIEARFASLENMINRANDLNTDLFVVAGDLFNSIQVAKRDIRRSVQILDRFNGACVLVLPGNHDYDDGLVELWREFTSIDSEKILVINEERPYSLEDYALDLLVYPAPCHSKHSSENSLGWIKDQGLVEADGYHLGIAHGALEGLSADIEGNYYQMSMRELEEIPVDLWLLGHTHVRYPLREEISDHKIFNAGTPEPDGLDYKDEGSAWLIELEEDGSRARRIYTGEYRFFDKYFELESDYGLEEIEEFIKDGKGQAKIVRLNLSGSISKEAYESLNEFYQDLQASVFHLIIEDSKLKARIDKETIEREFTSGSFPHEFLKQLADDEEALQIAYELIRRG